MCANKCMPADISSYSFLGYYNPDKKLMDDSRNFADLDRHVAIVFENAYGHSPKIRVAFSLLYHRLPPEAYSDLQVVFMSV